MTTIGVVQIVQMHWYGLILSNAVHIKYMHNLAACCNTRPMRTGCWKFVQMFSLLRSLLILCLRLQGSSQMH